MNREKLCEMRNYLSKLYRLNNFINSNLEELKRLRELSVSLPAMNYDKERVKGGTDEDKLQNAVCDIVELEDKIKAEIDEYVRIENEIREVINRQDDVDERLLLRLRYIEFNTFEQIAIKMNYSLRQIWRIHKKALKNVKMS